MTESEVLDAIEKRWCRKGEHVLLRNVAVASGRRYMDGAAVGMWPSRGIRLEGFEVKVDRHDFLNEMKDPAKADETYRDCDCLWLAVVHGVCNLAEVPSAWGVVVAHDSGPKPLNILRPPLWRATSNAFPRIVLVNLLRAAGRPGEALITKRIQDADEAGYMRGQNGAEVRRLNCKIRDLEEVVRKASLSEWSSSADCESVARIVRALRGRDAGTLLARLRALPAQARAIAEEAERAIRAAQALETGEEQSETLRREEEAEEHLAEIEEALR